MKQSYTEFAMNTPEAVKWMLQSQFLQVSKFKQTLGANLFSEFFGQDSIFVLRHGHSKEVKTEHEMWLKQRKLASLIFTRNNFKNLMTETFEDKAYKLVGILNESADIKRVDMQERFFTLTIGSTQRIFFGRQTSIHAEKWRN